MLYIIIMLCNGLKLMEYWLMIFCLLMLGVHLYKMVVVSLHLIAHIFVGIQSATARD